MEAEVKEQADSIDVSDLQDLIDIQGQNGNWNYDPYMHGLYNGLICARDVLRGVEPEYKEAPEEWLVDAGKTFADITTAVEQLNNKLPDPLTANELQHTILQTAARKIKDNNAKGDSDG